MFADKGRNFNDLSVPAYWANKRSTLSKAVNRDTSGKPSPIMFTASILFTNFEQVDFSEQKSGTEILRRNGNDGKCTGNDIFSNFGRRDNKITPGERWMLSRG